MNLLLDTHVFLWSHLEPERLGDEARRELDNPANELWLSPITAWETHLLAEKGRVTLDAEPKDWLMRALEIAPFREAPITYEVALLSRTVRLPHEDPADRFLVATATAYGCTLVTADDRIVDARACMLLPC